MRPTRLLWHPEDARGTVLISDFQRWASKPSGAPLELRSAAPAAFVLLLRAASIDLAGPDGAHHGRKGSHPRAARSVAR
jgi:hypothetical protein